MGDARESVGNDDHPQDINQRNVGGWRAVKYILANETFEKLASMSLIANIIVYLRNNYNLDGILLVNVVSIWSGSSNILSLPGALLSDAYLGRFYTLLIGSIISLLGMGTLTLTSAVPYLRPAHCVDKTHECMYPQGWQFAILYGALTLLALGSGCLRPCNIAFGADQFDTRTEKGQAQLQRFYSWWYFTFTLALLIALTAVVYVQTNISWTIGFAIPTACFLISIIIFLLGCHAYIYHKPRGSIFTDMAKVIVAARRKSKLSLTAKSDINGQEKSLMLYDPALDESENLVSKLFRTNRLNFFDKAAIIADPNELNKQGYPTNTWKLCSIQQVEQLKCLIGILPVWVTGILAFVAMDQQNTFGVLQSIQMNRKVGSKFVIPPAWIGLTSMITLSLWIVIYERIVIPLLRKLKKNDDARLSIKTRIGIGILMSIACMLVASIVEKKRRDQALKAGTFESPLSVGFLAPQLILSGLIEAFAAISIMEFFTTQMPESMRSIAGSIFFLSLSMASYLSSATVNIIHIVTKTNEGTAWLGGHDLNKNKLDSFYLLIAGVGFVNLFYFIFFSSNYIFANKYAAEAVVEKTPSRDLRYSSNRG